MSLLLLWPQLPEGNASCWQSLGWANQVPSRVSPGLSPPNRQWARGSWLQTYVNLSLLCTGGSLPAGVGLTTDRKQTPPPHDVQRQLRARLDTQAQIEGSGRIQGGLGLGGTLEARFPTRATMEFLKSVPAVRGRLVTSVMSCCPSGHIARRVGSMLWTQAACPAALKEGGPHPSSAICKLPGHQAGVRAERLGALPARALGHSPAVQQPFEVLEEGVPVLVDEALR